MPWLETCLSPLFLLIFLDFRLRPVLAEGTQTAPFARFSRAKNFLDNFLDLWMAFRHASPPMDARDSLAFALGLLPSQSHAQEKPTLEMLADDLTPQQFSLAVLRSAEYRESLLRRIEHDELPSAVELWLLNTAHGKPVERLEVKQVPEDLEQLSSEELRLRAEAISRRIVNKQSPSDKVQH